MADDFDPYYQWLGIPPKQQPPSHYRLLALEEFESNADVIENAADQRMAHVRQFQSGQHGEISQRLLNEITAAKLCLLNLAKKAEYDQKLRAEKDAAEPRRLRPFPRLEPTSAPTESYQLARDPEPPAGALAKRRRHLSPQLATMGGTALGLAVVCAIAYVSLSQNQPETPVNKSSDSAIVDAGKSIENSAAVPRKTAAFETKSSEPEKSALPKIKSSPTIVGSAESVFLDDLQEQDSKVGAGTLGKHGDRGFGDKLPAASYQGKEIPHALATHPPPRGAAYVVYHLNGEFAAFRGTAALLEFPGQAQAYGPVTFKVLGDSKLLWQSSPLQRLGTGEPFLINIQGVKSLRLEVHCSESGHAYAAWLMPTLTRDAKAASGAAPNSRAGGVTCLANTNIRFTVPQEHYACFAPARWKR